MSKEAESDVQLDLRRMEDSGKTYDCALLEPEAFPPDLPPVILMVLDG